MSTRSSRFLPALGAALCVAGLLSASPASAAPSAPAVALAPDPHASCSTGRPGFSHAFIDPYWFTGKTDAQVRTMLRAQQDAGIDGVILQWSTYRRSDGTVVAAYPESPHGYATLNSAVPRLVAAVRELGLELWAGLLVAPNVFEATGAGVDPALLGELTDDTLATAGDLAARHGDDIDGWYLPIEPNNKTIRTPEVAETQGRWIGGITAALHAAYPGMPLMSSPSMPTAILDGKTAMQFVEQFAPVFEHGGVDVWNIQDGYKMTAWTPEQEVEALLRARELAAAHGAEVWADVYTPGPDRNGAAQVTSARLIRFLGALGDAGFPLTSYMFASHMNPDLSLASGAARAQSYAEYRAYCG